MIFLIAVIFALYNVLDNTGVELGENSDDDSVEEDREYNPPSHFLGLILVKLNDTDELDASDGDDACQRRKEDDDAEVGAADIALVLTHDALANLTSVFIVNVLIATLPPLHAFIDLLFFLLKAPEVLDCRLLTLPRLHIEGGPEGNEGDIEIVDGLVDVQEERDDVALALFLVDSTLNELVDEEYTANYSRDQDPADMMEHEGEVEGVLLAIVVRDQVDWLEVLQP